jgi:hypothetical protein
MKESTLVQEFASLHNQINTLAGHIQQMAFAIESLAREGQVKERYLLSTAKNEEEKKAILDKLTEIRKQVQQEMIERVKKESEVRKVAQEMKDKADAVKTSEVSTSEAKEESKEAKA